MRVGISTSVMERGQGGVGRYVLALLQALRAHTAHHELQVFALEGDLPLVEPFGDVMELVTVPESVRPAVRDIAWHQTVLPVLAKARGLDVLHIPSYRRMVWSRPCALVATIHDLAAFHREGRYDSTRAFYGQVVARSLARRQDAIIAVSDHTARDLGRFFDLGVDRVRVIWNGIDHARFHPGDPEEARASAARRWGLDRPYFLYVSRLEHPAKNHLRLLEAYARFRSETGEAWLLALGGGDWRGAEVIHARAQESPFASDIRFLGFIEDDALPTLYQAAGAMVFPSLFEGFGFPPVEAMASGCPVISSTRGALAGVLGGAALHVDPEDVGSLSSALARVARDPPLASALREAGLRHAAHFDWARNAREVVETWALARVRRKRR